MFDNNSRYRDLPVATSTDAHGHSHAWVTLRIVADPPATLAYQVKTHERLDLLAARAYADPTAWWRIPDANLDRVTALPHVLVDAAGATIALAQPVRPDVMPQ